MASIVRAAMLVGLEAYTNTIVWRIVAPDLGFYRATVKIKLDHGAVPGIGTTPRQPTIVGQSFHGVNEESAPGRKAEYMLGSHAPMIPLGAVRDKRSTKIPTCPP
ncbi:hypothetical protein MASR2M48_34740 [Spirochaetota bacterium]